jgi:hypothetical protein
MSIYHSHLVDSSSSMILPDSCGNRVGTLVGGWVGCRRLIGMWLRLGAHMSIVALLSTVERPLLS